MPNNITFRTHLLGSVTEFCQNSHLVTLQNSLNLVDLIVRLARYQEEGLKLFPKVYLTNNITKIIRMLPDAESLKIGVSDKNSEGIMRALKKCAPMANGGWLVYINEMPDNIEYGVFKGSSNPTAVLVDDVIMTPIEHLNIVKVFQVADDCVEIRANNSDFHYVFLSHRREDDPPPLQHIDSLVESITARVKIKNQAAVSSYLKRVLYDSLVKSHGCIIAVTSMKRAPKLLSNDGVMLDDPIDFEQLIVKYKKNIISQSLIDSKSFILSGMLNSDGIVLFDNRSRILGYNIFVAINNNASALGGARRRAFENLKRIINRGLCAVFMQSHDGWSEFSGGA
ncbi:MAG: hypothetical protein JW943_16255 [Deltaproteobacteria bacterium]|nr:hypothetical protein [Deltaproteobacteria bacterium]